MENNKMEQMLEQVLVKLGSLEQGQAKLEQGQSKLEQDVAFVRQTVAKIEISHGNQIGIIYDNTKLALEKLDRLEPLEEKVENHDDRIWALEQERKTG